MPEILENTLYVWRVYEKFQIWTLEDFSAWPWLVIIL